MDYNNSYWVSNSKIIWLSINIILSYVSGKKKYIQDSEENESLFPLEDHCLTGCLENCPDSTKCENLRFVYS